MTDKRCTRCLLVKPTTEFYRRKDRPLGITPHCKACDKLRVKNYQQSDNGKRVLREYSRTDNVKAMRRKWRTSPNGKVSDRRTFKRMRQSNLSFRISDNLRRRLNSMLRRQRVNKTNRMIDLLSCPMWSFKIYLESLWKSGMSWDNYGKGKGKWQIDHIVPCALFDLTDRVNQRACFHFSNLQPMWSVDNLAKGAKSLGQFNLL